jgi:threonine dehydratase
VSDLAINSGDVQAAALRIDGKVLRTPCTQSQVLSQMVGANVWIKFENLQYTASFKERGAYNRLSQLTDAERRSGVCAMSAGNHAQAVAYNASRMDIRSTIVMPRGTPFTKVRNTRALGGTVLLHGESLADAAEFMQSELVEAQGMTLVHPYDDAQVMAGQGTVALEMLADVPQLDTLVIPIGGGGLFSGMAVAARALRPAIRLVGVESAGYCSAYAALQHDPTLVRGGPTIAEGIAVKNIGRLTLPVIAALSDDLVRVEEAAIERAIALLANVEKVVSEGAGAVGLAALLADPAKYAGRNISIPGCSHRC